MRASSAKIDEEEPLIDTICHLQSAPKFLMGYWYSWGTGIFFLTNHVH